MGTKSSPSCASKGRIKSISAPANPLKAAGQSQPGSNSKPQQR